MTDESQDSSTDTSDNANQAEVTKVVPMPDEHPHVVAYREIDRCGPKPTVTVTGLFAHSDDPEKQRVYLSHRFDYYADFVISDVLYYEAVPAEYSPISGYAVTRVNLKRGSLITFTYVRTQSLIADDQFDIDIRVVDRGARGSIPPGAGGPMDDRTMNPWTTGP